MKKAEAVELGRYMIYCIETGNEELAWKQLEPILDQKIPFAMLDNIANQYEEFDCDYLSEHLDFFEKLMQTEKLGAYPIIAQALVHILKVDFDESFLYAEKFIRMGDQWVVCDIFGERVIGQALIRYFDETCKKFRGFSQSDNRWMKRVVGVAAHVFAKKCRNETDKIPIILDLIEPMLDENHRDIVKGTGWGIKTLARFYPEYVMEFMKVQIFRHTISATVIRKCCTYLSDENEALIKKWYAESKNRKK